MNEEKEKEMREAMNKYYSEDGKFTEEGREKMLEDYALGAEFNMELTELCNKYVNDPHPDLFGFVWIKVHEGIQIVHNMQRLRIQEDDAPQHIFG